MKRTSSGQALEQDTVSAQVARHLLDEISRNKLKPGDAVDSEIQVCRKLQVSRGTVREAYRFLSALGVLEIGTGRRPRVREVNSYALAHIFSHALRTSHTTTLHVLELRRGIEIHGVQLAARFASEEQLARLRALVAEMRQCLNDEPRRIECDVAIHTIIAEASSNPLHVLVLAALRSAIEQSIHEDYLVQRSEAELIRIIDVHDAIVDRLCARDPVGAGAAMACHFDLSIHSLFRHRPARELE